MAAPLQTQVLIVGAGPCGVTIAGFLGVYGVSTILIDRLPDILDYPRAVGIDDEALRGLQVIGVADDVVKDMIRNAPLRYHDAKRRYLTHIRPQNELFGWPRRCVFLQPLLEAGLRKAIQRLPCVDFNVGYEATHLEQSGNGVATRVCKPDGEEIVINSDYVVGADGGRSTIRTLLGIELVGKTHAARWLVIDTKNDTLYAPYSGTYFDVFRPTVSIDLPYGYRRFEFRLRPEETEEEMLKPENMQRLMKPFYGETKKVPTIVRGRVYFHHSRCAESFHKGRVFLAGDAAHLQPPFFGQGMNSGQRDAGNISWKLAAVLKANVAPEILDTYDIERRGHAQSLVNLATWLGILYSPSNQFSATFRRLMFKAIQWLPPVREYILQMKFKPMARYANGIVLQPRGRVCPAVGRMFIQPYVETEGWVRRKLDDVIGAWFAVIGINCDPVALINADQLARWHGLGATFLQVNKSRRGGATWKTASGTTVADDVDGAFRDLLMENPNMEILILRPDRYLLTACRADEFSQISDNVMELVGVPDAASIKSGAELKSRFNCAGPKPMVGA